MYVSYPQETWKHAKMVAVAKTRSYPFLTARAACIPCGEDAGACAVLLKGRFPPSPTPREFVHPEGSSGPRQVLLVSARWLHALQVLPPCSWLLGCSTAVGQVSGYCVVPLTRTEPWTVYVCSEALLFIFWPWFLLVIICSYLSEGSVKTKYFRPRLLEEKLY